MIKASCHCGNITVTIKELPKSVTSCNCTICYRLGALWAYYPVDHLEISSKMSTSIYTRDQKNIEFHFCSHCGCSVYNISKERIAINARMLPHTIVSGIPVREFDGAVTWQYINELDT